jgi:hypothetical protein
MITQKEIDQILKTVPNDIAREVASALIGARDNMTPKEIARHYSVPFENVVKYLTQYDLLSETETVSRGKRAKKSGLIEEYLKQNYGKTITPHDVVEATGISMPTFYNFFNSNRGYFKKIKRGQFEVINPDKEREASK